MVSTHEPKSEVLDQVTGGLPNGSDADIGV
jgi:hypothetical protein